MCDGLFPAASSPLRVQAMSVTVIVSHRAQDTNFLISIFSLAHVQHQGSRRRYSRAWRFSQPLSRPSKITGLQAVFATVVKTKEDRPESNPYFAVSGMLLLVCASDRIARCARDGTACGDVAIV